MHGGPVFGHVGSTRTFHDRTDGLMTEQARRLPTGDAEKTSSEELRRLRQDYPDWGFLIVDDDRWTAVRGRRTLLQAPTPQELRRELPPLPGEERTTADARPDAGSSRPPAHERDRRRDERREDERREKTSRDLSGSSIT